MINTEVCMVPFNTLLFFMLIEFFVSCAYLLGVNRHPLYNFRDAPTIYARLSPV